MLYIIHKYIDGVELLPDITETPLWKDYDSFDCTPQHRRICVLYQLLAKRENYYQFYSTTAYGNPDYSLYCGEVSGFLNALDWHEKVVDNQIVIYKNNQKQTPVLIVDKVQKPQSYYDDVRNNKELINSLR